MALIVRGFTHHGSSLEVREHVAMPKQCLVPALAFLKAQPGVQEAIILSTCNRTECYVVADSAASAMKSTDAFFARAAAVHNANSANKFRANLTLLHDDAVLQLFRVASGLDSAIFGETQILGQVRVAFDTAMQSGACGPVLHKLFTAAIECARVVRRESGLSSKPTSAPAVAAEMALTRMIGNPARILIVGSGSMGSLCARHLSMRKSSNCRNFAMTILNRSEASLQNLAASLPEEIRLRTSTDFSSLRDLLTECDTVFVATSAPQYIITKELFQPDGERMHNSAPQKNKLILDLSFPRNVDPEIDLMPEIELLTLENLKKVALCNLQERQDIIVKVEPILLAFLNGFRTSLRSMSASRTIALFREQVQAIRQRCLDSAKSAVDQDCYDRLDRMSRQMVNQILHAPTVKMRAAPESLQAVSELFNLPTPGSRTTAPVIMPKVSSGKAIEIALCDERAGHENSERAIM